MNRPVCFRAVALASMVLVELTGAAVAAEQPPSVTPARQTETNQTPPPQSPPMGATQPPPAPTGGTAPQTGNGAQNNRVTRVGRPQTQMTPAQQRYGLPRNPIVGGPVDTDLSKPLSLERAVAIGLQQQNAIAIASTQAQAASARLVQARANYYPQITPSFQYTTSLRPGGRVFINGTSFGGAASSETVTDVIVARQLIWDTGRREATVGLNRRSLFSAEYNLADQRQAVILNVISSYYEVLRDQELVRVEEENVRRSQTTLESIRAQVEVGNAAQTDTLQAEADLANAQVALLQARNNLDVAQATLKNAMGVISDQPLALSTQPPTPSTVPDTSGVDHYTQVAYANRLDLKAQQERINAQGYNVRLANIDNGLSATADVTEGYQLDPDAGEERQFNVLFSYPLFNGGSTRAAVRESKATLEQERRTLDQLEQNVRLDVEQSYVTREQARQRIVASQTAVQAGQTNYNAALEKQRNGLINILDVLNAEAQLVNAQVNLVQAIYDFYIADARLQRDIGLNDPNYVPNVPDFKRAVVPPPPAPAKP
ncbi:MAG TPA: TolC family protein [Chthonomonadaceae bacterium]|nr:TolC family protein [Chthonomonadaceae bacterium]